jgi:hypothetical protein
MSPSAHAGALRVVSGDEAARLEAGDSCTCLAEAPHRFDSRDGDVEAPDLPRHRTILTDAD